MHFWTRFSLPVLAVFVASAQAQNPNIIEGGGFSAQVSYWLTSSAPLLRGGKQNLAPAGQSPNFDLPGKGKPAMAAMVSLPAGKENTLRISGFRAQGTGNTTAGGDLALFQSGYNTGDYLATAYKIEHAKVSWDYLSYTYAASGLRVKTLWEAQFTAIHGRVHAPFKDVTTDSSGNTNFNIAEGTKNVILPSFGLGLEQAPAKAFRWEARASGFALPGRSYTWNAEAAAVIRMGKFELLGGGRAFSVKTSSKDDAYYKQTLYGPYVGLRWYP